MGGIMIVFESSKWTEDEPWMFLSEAFGKSKLAGTFIVSVFARKVAAGMIVWLAFVFFSLKEVRHVERQLSV